MAEPTDQIIISAARYNYLVKRDAKLSKLEAAGVDNWEGYPGMGDEDDEDFGDEDLEP